MARIIRVSKFLLKLATAYICAFFIKLIDKTKRNIWIISERGDDARDNGYFFYKYMREQHQEQPIYYVIKSSSADFPKVASIGNWVEHNSFKHFIYYALSKVRISSSVWGGDLPYADYFHKLRRTLYRGRKIVALKHGITKDYLPLLTASNTPLDLFICGAKPEYEYVTNKFGHLEGVVKYTGFARFDNLHDFETKDQILVMPTFRRFLQGKTDAEIKESDYFKAWDGVLRDEQLEKILADNNLQLVFYPHYVMQEHVNIFSSSCERIIIAKFADYDVQQLLIESKLLITDFSSVFFDFAYMNKPVIYYQFDRERYIKEHYDYTKGYFDYDRDGFGPVAFNNETLVNMINNSVKSNFELKNEYLEKSNQFFVLKDKKNSKRIYEEIKKLLREKA